MACPIWRPDCLVVTTVNGVKTTAEVAGTVASGANQAADAVGSVAPFFPIIILVLIVYILLKLFGFLSNATIGAADVVSGGKATQTIEAIRPRKSPRYKHQRRQTRPKSNVGRNVGRSAATKKMRTVNARKGPQPFFHTGRGSSVIDRRDDNLGRPTYVTVCASNPGSASSVLDSKMQGHNWRASKTSKCDLNVEHKHFTFRKI